MYNKLGGRRSQRRGRQTPTYGRSLQSPRTLVGSRKNLAQNTGLNKIIGGLSIKDNPWAKTVFDPETDEEIERLQKGTETVGDIIERMQKENEYDTLSDYRLGSPISNAKGGPAKKKKKKSRKKPRGVGKALRGYGKAMK